MVYGGILYIPVDGGRILETPNSIHSLTLSAGRQRRLVHLFWWFYFDNFRFRFQMEHELRMSSEKCAALYEEKLNLEDQMSAIQSAQFIAQNQIQQMQVCPIRIVKVDSN